MKEFIVRVEQGKRFIVYQVHARSKARARMIGFRWTASAWPGRRKVTVKAGRMVETVMRVIAASPRLKYASVTGVVHSPAVTAALKSARAFRSSGGSP